MTEAKTQDDDCFPRSTKSKNLLFPSANIAPPPFKIYACKQGMRCARKGREKKNPQTERGKEGKRKTKLSNAINNLLRPLRLFSSRIFLGFLDS